MKPSDCDLTKCKDLRAKLRVMRDNYSLKWSEIVSEYPYSEIPLPTLSMIYHGKRGVPDKYKRLGVCERPPRHQFGWLMSFYETKEWKKVIENRS